MDTARAPDRDASSGLRRLTGTIYLGLVLSAFVACGGKAAPAPPDAPLPPLLGEYPALRWVPADATYAVAARSTRDASALMRELVQAGGIPVDVDPGEVERAMRASLGLSLLDTDDLAAIGIDLDGSTALFSSDLYPTMALPVGDTDALHRFSDRFRADRGVGIRRIMGHTVYRWDVGAGFALEWVELDEWLLLRWGPTTNDVAWLQKALGLDPRDGIAGDPDFAGAVRTVGDELELPEAAPVAGLVRVERLRLLLGNTLPAARGWPRCVKDLGLVERIEVGARADWSGADGVLVATLGQDAAAALREHVEALPPPGFYQLREDSVVYAGVAVNLRWLDGLRAATPCPVFGHLDPVDLRGAPLALHAAATSLDARELDGRGAVHLAIPGRDRIEAYLDSVPRRSWFESDERIGGVDVTVLDVPTLERLVYRLTDTELTAAYGRRAADRLFGAGPAAAPGDRLELAAFGLAPGGIRGLREALRLAGRAVFPYGIDGDYLERTVVRLTRYRIGRLWLELDRRTLILRGAMRLRR